MTFDTLQPVFRYDHTSILPVLCFLCSALAVGLWATIKPSRRKLPPGPVPAPIIGNARQIPSSFSWLRYTELAGRYGDVLYLTALGQPIIVLSSPEAISDLIVKKSSVFSGRPYLAMLGDLVGWDQSVTIGPPSRRWQAQRKLLHQFLGAPSMPAYHSIIEAGGRDFVKTVLPTREGFMNHFLFTIAKLTLRLTYGIKVEVPTDPLAAMAEEAALNFEDAIEIGKFAVNIFPFLRYLPPWFPLAGFKRTAALWRERLGIAVSSPFNRVKADMAAGHAEPSFTARCLENIQDGASDEHIKWASGSLYVAAARTTMTTTGVFLLAMIMHPEIQAKAQAELDREVGDRLPTLADRKNVPYIDNILKEVLRWHPATPMGLPHMTTEECEYRGWNIPKGATVFGNIWALSRDTNVYKSPEKFIPERYDEGPHVTDSRDYAFGFGRRVCPGQAFAEATVWITMATLLSTVNMRNALDESGDEIPLSENFAGTMVHDPLPFPYRLEPRSAHIISLLEASTED